MSYNNNYKHSINFNSYVQIATLQPIFGSDEVVSFVDLLITRTNTVNFRVYKFPTRLHHILLSSLIICIQDFITMIITHCYVQFSLYIK